MTGGQLSQDRLNQIAGRKLAELGVACAVGADGRLAGALAAGALMSPFSRAPVGDVQFVVEGHDHLRFSTPAVLAGLPPVLFFDAEDLNALLTRLAQLLHQRFDAISRLKTHLHHLRVDADVDADHAVLLAPVNVAGAGTVVLIGDEQGLRSSHLRPLGGGQNLPMPPAAIDLSQFADASDLELFVGELARRAKPAPLEEAPKTGVFRPPPDFMSRPVDVGFASMPTTGEFIPDQDAEAVADAARAAQPAAGAAEGDEFMPPTQAFEVPQSIAGGVRGQPAHGEVPAGAVTAGMLARCLGDTAQLAHGVAVMRKFQVGQHAVKLTLRQKRGRVFTGRVAWEGGVLWQGELQVDKHPPMDEFVYELLRTQGVAVDALPPRGGPAPVVVGTAPPAAAPKAPADVQPAFGHASGEQLPVAGEIWVMNVVVEKQDESEVRYSAINAEGQPYGAPRILPRPEFNRVFAENKGGFRLLVRVIGASPQQVVYVQLDPSYQPNSDTRAIAPSIFLANFLPEAADY